jgi:hypothetical protein
MNNLIGYFSPTFDQLAGLGAILAVCICLAIIGNGVSARKRLFELDVVAGWSVVSLAFVAGGGVFDIDFRVITWALVAVLAASVIVAYRRPSQIISGDQFRALTLALPFLWLAGCMMISQWDEFTHWMPNAWYLVEYNSFPGEGKPQASSGLPGYPHGLAYVLYLSSGVAGFLTENASAAFNIVLLSSFAILIGRLSRAAVTGIQATGRVGWTYCAIGCLAVTGLNPTFVPKVVFTAYADTPTAVLVGMLCVIMWYLLNTLAEDDTNYSPASLAWSFGIVGMASIAIKQPNVVLFGLVTIGGLLVALRDPKIRTTRLLKLLPVMVFPAIAIYVFWRLHIEANPVLGEFNFQERVHWLTDQIDVVFGKMLSILSKKGGYTIVMLAACLFAVRALWRIRTPFDRLSIIIAVLFAGYTSFLLFVYVTAFGGNGLVAPSYWRFNMHLGGACVAFGAYGIGLLWRARVVPRMRRNYAWVAFLLIVITPFAVSYKIRFDLHAPKIFVRMVSEDIAATIPRGVTFASFDNTGNGEFEVIARYVMTPHVEYVGFLIAASRPTEKKIRTFLTEKGPDYAWIHVPTKPLEQALNISLAPQKSHLVKRTGTNWTIVKSWPFPGYDNPNTVPK